MRDFHDISHYTVEINRLENDGDRIAREAIASLFDGGIDPMVVIRWKDIFERLEDGDRRLRARRQHPRGHRHQERLRRLVSRTSSSSSSSATALAFDFTNGFHDTANVVATSISTRAMPPRLAVACAAILNFVGAFISLKVAATVGKDIVDRGAITMTIVFAGLVGAIAWNLATWYFGLPSSSSHALIGGLVGAAFAAQGAERDHRRRAARQGHRPGGHRARPRVRRRRARRSSPPTGSSAALRPGPGQPRLPPRPARCRAGLLALSHGTNDAQKTMGIITLALVAHGNIYADRLPRARLGRRLLGDGDRARHLLGRLADHPHDGHAASSRWIRRRASRRRARAPRSSSPPRTPAIRCRRPT